MDGGIDIVGNGGTGNLVATEAVGVVSTGHGVHVLVLTDVLVTEDTVAGAQLEQAHEVGIDLEERFLVDAPSRGERREPVPTVGGGQAARTVATDSGLEKVASVIVVGQTADVGSQHMLALIGRSIALGGVADLKVIRLGEVVAPAGEGMVELALESHTGHGVKMMEAELSVIGEVVLHEEVAEAAVALAEALVALGQVVGRTLDEGRHESEVLGKGAAVGEVEVVLELVVLVLEADHVKEVRGGRAGGHDAVNERVAFEEIVVQQRVGHTDVTVDIIVVSTEAP